ncbi:MAG: glutamine--tRNA ligase/YqeY domain fusion protein [Ardenticatenaceae bacterium]|nr:glutamine--tRNA ligase/YqeY domain fusion protein [Ardenticatenaceae bacterium]
MTGEENNSTPSNFIRDIIEQHLANGRFSEVFTRFPPEPNGYLHIGHATAIHTNFSIADAYGGKTNLRFDDTNPTKEEVEYVEAIIDDIRWLEHEPDRVFYASDYFDQLYTWAIQLIKQGDAYVDDLSQEEMREYRGTLTEPGRNSPFRDRSVEENLDLFERMKNGEFDEGSRVLRAKIDMAHPNVLMRDPTMYRILKVPHHRTGEKWCIYPMYDWAHGQSDSIEGITHSLCSLEYVNHRPLYEWFIEKLGIYAPQQIEFSRISLNYTVVSKRKLRKLVEEGYVEGWDDPRMPTLVGLRRRGYPAAAVRTFCDMVGVVRSTYNVVVDYGMLEYAVRNELNMKNERRMAVLDPLKVVIENYPEGKVEYVDVDNYPQYREGLPEGLVATRKVPFSREIFIERGDFMEDPPRKFFRMAPGREVRLMKAYLVTCTEVIKDEAGEVIELRCTYDPDSYGGNPADGRKVKGTLHWVSAGQAVDAEVRLYDKLFLTEDPEDVAEGEDFTVNINPDSLQVVTAKVEPSLAEAAVGASFQFMRHGYFAVDPDSQPNRPVFNRTVGLRDTWAKTQKK